MKATVALAGLAALFGVLAIPQSDALAQSRTGMHQRHYAYRTQHTFHTGNYAGWRRRSNARGWDNTCLSGSGLPSMYACSAR